MKIKKEKILWEVINFQFSIYLLVYLRIFLEFSHFFAAGKFSPKLKNIEFSNNLLLPDFVEFETKHFFNKI
jgi:hypothetical protein